MIHALVFFREHICFEIGFHGSRIYGYIDRGIYKWLNRKDLCIDRLMKDCWIEGYIVRWVAN